MVDCDISCCPSFSTHCLFILLQFSQSYDGLHVNKAQLETMADLITAGGTTAPLSKEVLSAVRRGKIREEMERDREDGEGKYSDEVTRPRCESSRCVLPSEPFPPFVEDEEEEDDEEEDDEEEDDEEEEKGKENASTSLACAQKGNPIPIPGKK